MKQQKTNVMRVLDREKIPYTIYTYPHGDGPVDGVTVAELTGNDPGSVFKTLVTVGESGQHYVFDIPVTAELDLKKAARAVGEKSVSMIHVSQITPVTGYVRGGCSPIGMKKRFPTVFDTSVGNCETVCVSGGRIGVQIALAPERLLELVAAEVKDVTVEGGACRSASSSKAPGKTT